MGWNTKTGVVVQHEMNSTDLPVIMGHTPAGTSTLNMVHYAQVTNACKVDIRGAARCDGSKRWIEEERQNEK